MRKQEFEREMKTLSLVKLYELGKVSIGSFLYEFLQTRLQDSVRQNAGRPPVPSITALRGTLHQIDISDLRDETDRPL
jgi:hypothetical protein